MDKLGFTICDPCGHPWICCVPRKFVSSEVKHLQKKIKREGLKVRKTTLRDVERVLNWTFENYQKRIQETKSKK